MPPPRVHLHIDARRGIAGDMLLAALLDLGVPSERVFGPLSPLPPHSVEVSECLRRGIRVRQLRVRGREDSPPHRGWREIEALILRLDLPQRARETALACFDRIATAEASVHGIPKEKVHFHEIGAIDSLVDILGVCLAVAHLDPVGITVSSLPLGSGTVRTAHGTLPVPAPATLRLLQGVPTHPFPVEREVTTPTGAALAAVLADRFGDPPPGTILADGTGAGQREAAPDEPPNLLRVWTSVPSVESAGLEEVTLLETNLDTVPGEDAGDYISALLREGALDAWMTPILGKKGRPGLVLSCLAPDTGVEHLRRRIFRLTGTLGVRQRRCERAVLPREVVELPYEGGVLRVKRGWHEGELLWERPEHEDLARIARETGETLREVRSRVERHLAALREEGEPPPPPSGASS
ncbi:MAG: nickel pincer cofactor biosynthesis protein LarC [Planctomycetota bacterium]